VEELKDLMKPFVRCLDKLQVDKAQLHDVILSIKVIMIKSLQLI
ncbi:15967_t:CDS:1, partial [Entrophospora sp. SA101]